MSHSVQIQKLSIVGQKIFRPGLWLLSLILTGVFWLQIVTPIYAQAPIVQSTSPMSNTHTAPMTTSVSVIYDQAINPATVLTPTFAIHAMQTGQLLQTYNVNSNIISLTPLQPFKPGEVVQTSATRGILSLGNGNGPDSPTIWQFRTAVRGGSGLFDDNGQNLGTGWWGVAVGDVDGDGDLDAFIGQNGPARVYLNNGGMQGGVAGTFTDSGQGLGNSLNVAIALGDVDGDGDLDAFAPTYDGANKIWLNNGGAQGGTPGTFNDNGQNLGYSVSRGAALGDVDGDGDLDAFVPAYGGVNKVWLNNGGVQGGTPGTFIDSGQNLSGSSYNDDVALGDVDGDGDLDAFVAVYYPNGGRANKVWLNNGGVQGGAPGTFSDSGQNLGNSASTGVALGDVDGDSDLDALVTNYWNQANKVWLNNGMGIFNDSGQSLGSGFSNNVSLGDLDGDGDLDAFIARNGSSRIWLNNGTGTFSNGQNLDTSYAVALGDLDNDGDLDAFTTDINFLNKVWLNRNRMNLSLTKTVTPITPVIPGQTITYTISFVNAGPGIAAGVIITDIVPITLTNITSTSTGAMITPTGAVNFVWMVQDLMPGEGGTITITGQISPDLLSDSTFTNTAIITSTAIETDINDNQAEVGVTIQTVVDVGISKRVEPLSVGLGQPLTYTLLISNAGPSDASGVILSDIIPAEVVSPTWQCVGIGATCPASSGNGNISATLTLPEGSWMTYTITGAVSSSMNVGMTGQIITNTATISTANQFDSATDNNVDSASFTVPGASPPGGDIFLPIIFRGFSSPPPGSPDLVIDSLVTSSNAVTVVVRNAGTGPVVDAFWVDVYLNPSAPPTINQPWQAIASQGLAWGVIDPLSPQEVLTLTIGSQYYYASESNITLPLAPDTQVWAQVDSVNYNTNYGNVKESREDNNIKGPVSPLAGGLEEVTLPSSDSSTLPTGVIVDLPTRR
jgi:uncharacterized repeat protein (TIGR01451 family)